MVSGEELETAASVFYKTAPEYFKVILEACVALKQKNPNIDEVQVLQIPYQTCVPEYQFLSQAVDRLKRRKKTESLFKEARHLFGIDFVFQEGQLFAYFVSQNHSKIKPRGQIVQQPLSDIGEMEKSEKLRSSEEGEKGGASFTKAIKQEVKVVEKDHEFLQFSSFSISQSIERIRRTKALPLKKNLCWRCYNRLSPEDQRGYEFTSHNGACDMCGLWEVGLYELKETS
jgi:hypothetical protein